MFAYRIKKILKHWPILFLTVAYLLLSLAHYLDFSMTEPEIKYYENGASYIEHTLKISTQPQKLLNQQNISTIDQTSNSTYPFVAGVLYLINFTNDPTLFHLINLVFFFVVILITYVLMYKKYKNTFLSIVGPLLVLTQPRLIGHLASSPQQTFFTIFFFSSLSMIYIFSKLRGRQLGSFYFKTSILGLLFGLTQSLNLFGYTLYIIFTVLFIHNLCLKPTRSFSDLAKFFMELSTITVFAHAFMALTWPYLAVNPLSNLSSLFINMVGNSHPVIYLGELQYIKSIVYYTTLSLFVIPLPILLLLFFSGYFFIKKIRDDLFFLFTSTILIFLALSLAFNFKYSQGVEDILFLFPIVGVISSIVFIEIVLEAKDKTMQNIFFITVFALYVNVAINIVRIHPFQHLYFNEFIENQSLGANLFGDDYLLTSYRIAADSIPSDNVIVYSCEQREIVDFYLKDGNKTTSIVGQADYVLCRDNVFGLKPYKSIKVGDFTLNNIFRVSY